MKIDPGHGSKSNERLKSDSIGLTHSETGSADRRDETLSATPGADRDEARQQVQQFHEPLEITRIRTLMDRLTVANERFLRSTLRLVVVCGPDELATLIINHRPDKPPCLDVPVPCLDGLKLHDWLGASVLDSATGRSNVLLELFKGGQQADEAAQHFCELAAESGRLYQTLRPTLAPIHATTSPRNLWATVLYGWLRGTAWVQKAEGYEFIRLPFAASVELWRRLLYGTTPDGKINPGSSPPTPLNPPRTGPQSVGTNDQSTARPPQSQSADAATTEPPRPQCQTTCPRGTAPEWLSYSEAMLILSLSRTRVSDYVKSGDLTDNGMARKKKKVSAQSVALLKLKLEKERIQEEGRNVPKCDRVNDGPAMDAVPNRPTIDELAQRVSKGKSTK